MRRLEDDRHVEKATAMWKAMTENEQAGVRFGMFPYHAMMAAEQAGYDGHRLVIALMAIASENGGMRA